MKLSQIKLNLEETKSINNNNKNVNLLSFAVLRYRVAFGAYPKRRANQNRCCKNEFRHCLFERITFSLSRWQFEKTIPATKMHEKFHTNLLNSVLKSYAWIKKKLGFLSISQKWRYIEKNFDLHNANSVYEKFIYSIKLER